VNSWRWKGVPFYIRAGKCLPETVAEVLARLHLPPSAIKDSRLCANYMRFRISPDMVIGLGTTVMASGEEMTGEQVELEVVSHPSPAEMEAYERVLGDAMAGDATLFAREDYVEEAWRIVDPYLKTPTPVYEYSPNTWGPPEAARLTPPGGWDAPDCAAS
jgi:glucose-6-phosphate 1-dehydrogenase